MSSLLVFNRVPKVKVQYMHTVLAGGEGVLSCVGDHILQGVYHSVSDQIQNLQNCFTTPKQKPRSGGASDR